MKISPRIRLVVLAAAGLAWLLIQAFALFSSWGVPPGIVVAVLVLAGLGVSLYRAGRAGQL